MAQPNAAEMVTVLETALLENAGVVEVQVDNQRIKYDRKQALEELKYWKAEAARQEGRRPLSAQIRLNNSW